MGHEKLDHKDLRFIEQAKTTGRFQLVLGLILLVFYAVAMSFFSSSPVAVSKKLLPTETLAHFENRFEASLTQLKAITPQSNSTLEVRLRDQLVQAIKTIEDLFFSGWIGTIVLLLQIILATALSLLIGAYGQRKFLRVIEKLK